MLETYKAKIHGDKIEWETDAPKILQNDKAIEVFVTILEKDSELENPTFVRFEQGRFCCA